MAENQTCRTCSDGKPCMNWILCGIDGGLHVACEPICWAKKKQLKKIEYRKAELNDMRMQLNGLIMQSQDTGYPKEDRKKYYDMINALDQMLSGQTDLFADIAKYKAFRLLVPFKKRPGYKQFETVKPQQPKEERKKNGKSKS